MKTGITGFIASQDAVIVIDANRKKVFTVALGVKTTHRKGEGGLPQGLPRRIALVNYVRLAMLLKYPRPWSHKDAESGSPSCEWFATPAGSKIISSGGRKPGNWKLR